jgi:hypothetical protein
LQLAAPDTPRGSSSDTQLVNTLRSLSVYDVCLQVMSKLAAEHKSVNLGQGFPDDEGPESMKQVGSK